MVCPSLTSIQKGYNHYCVVNNSWLLGLKSWSSSTQTSKGCVDSLTGVFNVCPPLKVSLEIWELVPVVQEFDVDFYCRIHCGSAVRE